MKLNVTEIEIIFSKGSFAEWANMVDEQNEEDITRWEAAYNKQIEKEIKEFYPHASVEVGEGHERLPRTKYYVNTEESPNNDCDYEFLDGYADYFAEEETKQTIDHILTRVASAGLFWD